ncbi:MAG: hypothetical protein LC793_02440 [Thermomicrobia bacterium]|nr:hypothetical protein [Thermomicrobia bacterium]
MRDLKAGGGAPEAGAVGFFRRKIAGEAGKRDGRPGDTVRAALEGDPPAPRTGDTFVRLFGVGVDAIMLL